MPTMKIAFSTACCPDWDLDTTLARAKEYGFDGMELASAVGLGEAADIRRRFADAGVEMCCVGSHSPVAEALGCPLIKVGPPVERAGRPGLPMDPEAAEAKGLTLLIENAGEFRTARRMWDWLEQWGDLPALAVSWNVLAALTAGERPALSIPTLNRRIAYVEVADARISAEGVAPCKLGEGDVPMEQLMTRLRGIGYDGWVTVSSSGLAMSGAPEEVLPDALAKLRRWSKPPAPAPAKKAEAPKAKPEPKTAV